MAFINFVIHGYGGEVVLGKISKRAAEFWQSEDMEEHFHNYVFGSEWFEEENPNIKIPKYAQIGTWHDLEDRGHEWGASQDGAYLTINEVSDDTWNADHVRDIFYAPLMDYVNEHEVEIHSDECHPDPKEYTFCGVNSEKGTFYEGTIEIKGEFDPKKVSFGSTEIHQDTLITQIYYDNEDIDNSGGGTDSKSMDFEIIEPWE